MKHPCSFKNTKGHDYSMHLLKEQMPQILDVPSGLIKQNKK
jgi:hypothetical protein